MARAAGLLCCSGRRIQTIDVIRPPLHPQQRTAFDDPARFKVLACGRRWGKTRLAATIALEVALHGGRVWWIGPTYKVAAIGWRLIKQLTAPLKPEKSETERRLQFPGDGEIWVKSADDPDGLRGEGLDLAIFDECAYIQEQAWHVIRPALTDRRGGGIFISSPAGRNWFWKLFQRAQLDPDWTAYQFPSSGNPFLEAVEIQEAKDLLPDLVFRQEYMAEFLEGEGTVFRNISACMNAPLEPDIEAHKGHRIVAGVDWAKQSDYTAVSIGCNTCRQELAIDRFNKIDFHFQRDRIKMMAERWRVDELLVELNSIGEPNFEELQRDGLPVYGFTTSATSKPPLIENMALALEKQEWQFISDPIWTGELEAYEMQIQPRTGRTSYGAPSGLHDDTVIARALMVRASTLAPWFIT